MRILLVSILVVLATCNPAAAESPSCKQAREDLFNTQVALAACKFTQQPVVTAPEIQLATLGRTPVTASITTDIGGVTDLIMGLNIRADWLILQTGVQSWNVTFTAFTDTPNVARGAVRVLAPDGATYLYPIRVEIQ